MKTLKCALAIVAIGVLAGVCQVKADVVSFDLTVPDPTPIISTLTGPGPFANVSINLTSPTTSTITFTSLTNSGLIFLMFDGGSVDVNVNAATWALGPITGLNSGTGFTPGPFSDAGGNIVPPNDGFFGTFNQTIADVAFFNHAADTVTFSLTNTSGTWASASSVLTPNSDGWMAAAHIAATTDPANAANNPSQRGTAGGALSAVPDGGSTLILLGSALGCLRLVRRFIRR